MAQITLTPIIEGTLAKASEVMGNFQAIADEMNGNLDGSNLKDNIITSAKIVDGAVTDTKLASGSVDTTNLKNNAVTEAKLATGSVSSSKIVDGAVSESKIAGLSVTEDKIAGGAVTTHKIAQRAITNSRLDNLSVGTSKISDGAVTAPKLGTNAVTESKLATDSVSTIKIQNGAVTNGKLASGIDAGKLTIGTLPPARIGNGAITPARTNFMGNITRVFTGRVTSGATGTLPPGWTVARNPASSVGAYTITHNLGTLAYTVLLSINDVPLSPGVPVYSRGANQLSVYVRRPGSYDEYVNQGFDFILAML